MEQAARDAIENVQDPEEAELLLRQVTAASEAVRLLEVSADREQRWRGVRLKAERKYGQLLGAAEIGGQREGHVTGSHVAPEERKTQERARKVAAVPGDVFDEYVASEPKPSREGLLRKAKPASNSVPRRSKPPADVAPADIVERLRQRIRQVRGLDARVRPRWTLEDADNVESALKQPKPRASYSGRRLRQLHAQKRAGRTVGDLWYLQKAIAETIGVLEGFDLPQVDWSEESDDLMFEMQDDLARGRLWLDSAEAVVVAHMSELGRQRLASKLRALMDAPSASTAERAQAARALERLKTKRALGR